MGSAYSINPGLGLIMVGPIEPLYLMSILFVFPNNLLFLFIVNALVSSFIGVFVFRIGNLIGYRRAGWYAGLYIGVYKFFIGNGFFISAGKDMLMTLAMLVCVYTFLKWLKSGSSLWKHILALSVAIHLDERFLSIVIVVGLILMIRAVKKRSTWMNFLTWVLGMIFLSVPWLVRNYYAHEKIVLLSPRISQFIDPLIGQKTDINILDGESNAKSFTEAELDSIASGTMTTKTYVYSGRTAETMIIPEPLIEEVKSGNRPVKFGYAQQVQHAARDYFIPIYWKREWTNLGYTLVLPQNKSVWISTILSYLWLLPFGLYGMWIVLKERTNIWMSISIIAFYWSYALLNILFMPFIDNRYRWPIDGIMILLSFIALETLISKMKKWNNGK
jgi:hypothetical protein